VRRYQVRSFEVFVAQVSGDQGRSIVFSSVPAEADRQQQQLRGVLHRLGATPSTPVTILSDGADGPRSLGEAACIGPTSHVLDWFHLAMRIQHVAQAAKGWPADTPGERADNVRLADAVEHIRWRLWHGQVQRALDLIGETLTSLEGMAEAALTAAKATALVRGLETYVSRQADLIIDYATAQRCDEPISTATTEGTVQWLLHRRMGTNQQMRWTTRGAHCMLKVRTAVANDTLAEDHAAAERWARRPEHLSVYQTSPELREREAFEEKLDGAPEATGEPGKSSAGELGRLAVRVFFSAGAGLLAWSHMPVETAQ
jgi:hypothetical protein